MVAFVVRKWSVAIGVIACAGLIASLVPEALSVDGAKQIFDNARVTAWDVTWQSGPHGSVEPNQHDTVVIALTAGAVKMIRQDGTSTTASHAIGDLSFERKGTGHREEAIGSAPPPRSIVIELKDAKVTPLANTSGYPLAFPRPGSKKVLENDRITAWDYTWTPGSPTPTHFHDKDVVVVYLEDGELASTTLDGQVVNNPHFFGFTKFNLRDRTHTETLVKGKARAIIVELK
jgi:hypothetical protein